MAYFAQIDKQGNVINIEVVNNSELLIDGVEHEGKGIELLKKLHGRDTEWKQTSYNGKNRGCFASKDHKYNLEKDAFEYKKSKIKPDKNALRSF
jgi:squalene cyclase